MSKVKSYLNRLINDILGPQGQQELGFLIFILAFIFVMLPVDGLLWTMRYVRTIIKKIATKCKTKDGKDK